MNKQGANGIEWTMVEQEGKPKRKGFTWNPSVGCYYGCKWDGVQCYAKTVAEGIAKAAYPKGFEHHYFYQSRLAEPTRVLEGAGIFTGSMGDMFGAWVDDSEIQAILNVMWETPQHIYFLLTKNESRLPQFQYPPNAWVGMSLPRPTSSGTGQSKRLMTALGHMANVDANVRYISMEPLWFDVLPVFKEAVSIEGYLPFEWAIIGALSEGRRKHQPRPGRVQATVDLLRKQRVPIFMKNNLETTERIMEWPQ